MGKKGMNSSVVLGIDDADTTRYEQMQRTGQLDAIYKANPDLTPQDIFAMLTQELPNLTQGVRPALPPPAAPLLQPSPPLPPEPVRTPRRRPRRRTWALRGWGGGCFWVAVWLLLAAGVLALFYGYPAYMAIKILGGG